MDIKLIVNLVLSILIVFVLLNSITLGFAQGFKKTGIRFIWNAVIFVTLLFTAPLITNGLLNLNVSFLNLNVGGEACATFNIFIEKTLLNNPQVAEMVAGNPKILEIISSLIVLFASSIVFLLLFILIRIILWPIFAIATRRRKDKIVTQDKNGKTIEKKVKRPIKHKALGGLVGVGVGAMLVVSFMFPLVGMMDTIHTLNEIKMDNGAGQEVGIVDLYLPPEGYQIINAIDTSVGMKIMKYTGLEFMSRLTFNTLTTSKVAGEKVSLKDEVAGVGSAMQIVKEIQNFDRNTATKEDVKNLVEVADKNIDVVLESGLVSVLFDNVLPTYLDEILKQQGNLMLSPEYDPRLKQAIVDYTKNGFSNVKQDLKSIVSALKELSSTDALYYILTPNPNIENVINSFNSTMISNIFSHIIDTNCFTQIVPVFAQYGVYELAKNVKAPYEEVEIKVLSEEDKNLFKGIFTSIANIYDLNKSNIIAIMNGQQNGNVNVKIEDLTLNVETINNIGAIVNSILHNNFIPENVFETTIDFAREAVSTAMQQKISNSSLILEIESVINKLKTINIEDAFADISQAVQSIFDYAKQAVIDMKNHTNIADSEFVLNNAYIVGQTLDKLRTTPLFNNFDNILKHLIDEAYKQQKNVIADTVGVPVIEIDEKMLPILENIKANLSSVKYEIEIRKIVDIIKKENEIIKTENGQTVIQKLIAQDNNDLMAMGTLINDYLDRPNSETSLISKELLANLLDLFNNKIKALLPPEMSYLNTIIEKLPAQVNGIEDFAEEGKMIKILLDFYENTLTKMGNVDIIGQKFLTKIGQTLDKINGETNTFFFDDGFKNEVIAVMFDYAKTKIEDPVFQEVLTDLNTNVKALDVNKKYSYLTLLGAIDNLLGYDSSQMDFATTYWLVEFGKLLDDNENALVTKNEINKIIVKFIDASQNQDEQTRKVIAIIKKNLSLIESYEVEFTYVHQFIDVLGSLKFTSISDFNAETIGSTLDEMTNSKLLGTEVAGTFDEMFTEIMGSIQIPQSIKNDLQQESKAYLNATENNPLYKNLLVEFKNIMVIVMGESDGSGLLDNISKDTIGEKGAIIDNIKNGRIIFVDLHKVIACTILEEIENTVESPVKEQIQKVKTDIQSNKFNGSYADLFTEIQNTLNNAPAGM